MPSSLQETGAKYSGLLPTSLTTKHLRSSYTISALAHLLLLPLILAFNIPANKHPSRAPLHVILLDPIATHPLSAPPPHAPSPPSPIRGVVNPAVRTVQAPPIAKNPALALPTPSTPPVTAPQLPLPPSLDTVVPASLTAADDLLAKSALGSDSTGGGERGNYGGSPSPRSAKSCRAQAAENSANAQTTPLEILLKPKPAYTPEARELHLEGEVLLEVVFLASGDIRIVRVARGLGHGLDETAAEAATHIHFKPASCAGAAMDVNATVHVTFQLPKRQPSAE